MLESSSASVPVGSSLPDRNGERVKQHCDPLRGLSDGSFSGGLVFNYRQGTFTTAVIFHSNRGSGLCRRMIAL